MTRTFRAAFRAALGRVNPALPPGAGCIHDLAARVIITGSVVRVLENCRARYDGSEHEKWEEVRAVCARHLIEEASLSWLVGEVKFHAVEMARDFTERTGLAVAPLGSGRARAADAGGRIGGIVSEVARLLTSMGEVESESIRLTAQAWPVLARAVEWVAFGDLGGISEVVADSVMRYVGLYGLRGKPCRICREAYPPVEEEGLE